MSSLFSLVKNDYRIPVWIYKWLAIMPYTGFFGFDHWALGRQDTGFLKLFVNLTTLG